MLQLVSKLLTCKLFGLLKYIFHPPTAFFLGSLLIALALAQGIVLVLALGAQMVAVWIALGSALWKAQGVGLR